MSTYGRICKDSAVFIMAGTPMAPRPAPRTRQRLLLAAGFTMVELITVLVVVSILGAIALPRFVGRNAFDTFGFSEQTAQMLRFAQKSAIARRRTVCISQSGSAVSLSFASAADSWTCNQNLLNPADGQHFSRPIPGGIALAGLASPLRFNALGQPVDSSGTPLSSNQSLVITGEFSRTLTVEAETGHVY